LLHYPVNFAKYGCTVGGTVPELQAIARGDIDHVSVQPAIGEGVMSMKMLWKMMKSGKRMLPTAEARDDATLGGDELWRPVKVVNNPGFKGPWFKTQAYQVPEDVSYDDPRVWSNKMYKEQNGTLPDYEK